MRTHSELEQLLPESYLKQRYIVDDLTSMEIAQEVGVTVNTVRNRLAKLRIQKPRMHLRHDLTGKVFGNLTVESVARYAMEDKESLKKGKWLPTAWNCICICGSKIVVTRSNLTTKNTKSCGCTNRQVGKKSKKWKGFGEISGTFWNQICKSAEVRHLHCSLTVEEAWNLFLKQERKCAYTGVVLTMSSPHQTEHGTITKRGTASLDRIDSKKDYSIENVQWVHKDINKMKLAFTHEEFLSNCRAVATYAAEHVLVHQESGSTDQLSVS